MSCIPDQAPEGRLDPLCRIPYGVLILGLLIAFISSLKLQVGATAYEIHWTLFVFGLVPYVIYSGFLIMPNSKWLAISGIVLIVADLALRGLAPGLNVLAGYRPLWLIVLLLVTIGIGIFSARQRATVHPEESPTPANEPDNPS